MRLFKASHYSGLAGIIGLFALSLGSAVFAQSAPTPLVRHGDLWNYRKGVSEPPADWTSVDDSSLDGTWQTGMGGFGYGDGDDATILSDMENGYLTVYTRKSFEVTGAMDLSRHLQLSVDYDDACIVYLDGREVYRSSNIPGPTGVPYPFDQETLTGNHDSSGGGGGPVELIDLGPATELLATGTSVLAAQGINGALDSSDFSLIVDLALVDGPTDITWTAAESPVILTSDFTIGGGRTLTIEAGVEVILSAGVSILATEGSHIEIGGTAAAPVIIRPEGTGDWGALSSSGSGGTMTIRHADISGGQIRFLTGVTGLMEDCYVHDSGASSIVNAVAADSVTLRRCQVENYAETLFRNTLTLLEECLFEAPTADAVDFDAAKPGSTIRQCTFRNGPTGSNTDAIDIGPTGGVPSVDVLIEDCIMHNFSDKGVSIGDGPSDAENIVVRNCLIYDVARGVQIKHGSVVKVQNCTIVDSLIGLHGYEKPGATGGGIFEETFNNIVATSADAVVIETNTTFAIEYSNTEGQDWAGTGNLNVDPLFTDPANRDFRLLVGSPCLGTGRDGEDMGISYPVGGVPDVPKGLQVISYDGSNAALLWNDPDSKESQFIIEQSPDGASWSIAATVPANATVTDIPGLDGNESWLFRIRGENFLGSSFNTAPVSTGVPPVDTDGDGMPDSWENLFPDLDAGINDAGGDLDQDGATNLQEYLAGTDPTDSGSVLRIDAISEVAADDFQIQFAAQAGRAYLLQYSATLQPGSWVNLAEIPAEPGLRPTHSVNDTPPAATPRRFYRLFTSPLLRF